MLPLAGLFLSAFLAATILPVSSEVVLGALLVGGCEELWLLVAVASLGNTAGAVVNWLLGRFLAHYHGRSWFPINEQQYARASAWFGRFGIWSLLFAWVPIVGDPLTVVAGLLKVRFWPFLALVAIGKTARYIVLAQAVAVAAG